MLDHQCLSVREAPGSVIGARVVQWDGKACLREV